MDPRTPLRCVGFQRVVSHRRLAPAEVDCVCLLGVAVVVFSALLAVCDSSCCPHLDLTDVGTRYEDGGREYAWQGELT